MIDARLRRAVDAGICWYEEIFALHSIGAVLADGLCSGVGPAPPLHSDAVAALDAGWEAVGEHRVWVR